MTAALKRAAAWGLWRAGLLGLHANRFERRTAALLVYHRVNDDADPFFPALPRGTFAAQLDFLAAHYRVEPLEEVVRWLAAGAPGRARAAITFDDGHPDTAEVAFPELERRGLPATLFLSTAPPETGEPLWTDRVRWVVRNATVRAPQEPALGLRDASLDGETSRLALLDRLLRELKAMPPPEVDRGVHALEAALRPEGPPLRVLGWDAVRRMTSRGLHLGGHTHRHYMVSRLDERTLEDEVVTSHRLIEERTGRRVLAFAYPNGQAGDYDGRAVALLERLGLLCAVTCRHALARPDHDTFRLPRLYTSGPSLALFAARLAGLGREDVAAPEVS